MINTRLDQINFYYMASRISKRLKHRIHKCACNMYVLTTIRIFYKRQQFIMIGRTTGVHSPLCAHKYCI